VGLFFLWQRPKRCTATLSEAPDLEHELAVRGQHIKYTLEALLASNPVHQFPAKTGCDADNAISPANIAWTHSACVFEADVSVTAPGVRFGGLSVARYRHGQNDFIEDGSCSVFQRLRATK